MRRVVWLAGFVLVIFCMTSAASADIIYSNDIGGPTNSATPLVGNFVAPGLNVSQGLTIGSGLSSATANGQYSASGWSDVNLLPNADPNDYFTWNMTPTLSMNLQSLVMKYQGSTGGPQQAVLRSSIDGFISNISSDAFGAILTVATSESLETTFDLSDLSFQNLTGEIEFRLLGWNAPTASSTFSVNEFQFNGTVAVPEPASLFLINASIAVCSLQRRR